MKTFQYGDTLNVTYPGKATYVAGFVVARGEAGHPYLICYNASKPTRNLTLPEPALTQGERFMVEGVPFKVDDDSFALSVGEVTGKERSAIIPA